MYMKGRKGLLDRAVSARGFNCLDVWMDFSFFVSLSLYISPSRSSPYWRTFTIYLQMCTRIRASKSDESYVFLPMAYARLNGQKHKVRYCSNGVEEGERERDGTRAVSGRALIHVKRPAGAVVPRSDDRFCQPALTLCRWKKETKSLLFLPGRGGLNPREISFFFSFARKRAFHLETRTRQAFLEARDGLVYMNFREWWAVMCDKHSNA